MNWWMMVSSGFPHGSGLSPLLVNIFVRRLPRHCNSSTLQFADDTTLATADPSLSVVAQDLTASFNSVKEFSESRDQSVSHLVGWAPPATNIKVLRLVKLPCASSTAPSVVSSV